MKKSTVVSFLLGLSFLFVGSGCNDGAISRITGFTPNSAPEIVRFQSRSVLSDDLNAGDSIVIDVTIREPEGDPISFAFNVDAGTIVVVSHEQRKEGQSTIDEIVVQYQLPAILPAGFAVAATLTVSDSKRARSLRKLNLGSGRVGLGILGNVNKLYTQPNGDIQVEWSADNNGFFQVRLLDPGAPCTMAEDAGFQYYNAPAVQQTTICGKDSVSACDPQFRFDAGSSNLEKKLCIIIRDNLQQDASISFVLTSDDQEPETALDAALDSGVYSLAQNRNLLCSDNFSCAYISYIEEKDSVPADPNFAGTGTVVEGSQASLLLGNDGDGLYTLKFRSLDSAGNIESTVHTVSYTVDSNLPNLTVSNISRLFISSSGYIDSVITWSADKNGSYHFKTGSSCANGNSLGIFGSYSTTAGGIPTTIKADDIAHGVNTVRLCFTATSGLTAETSFSLERDENAPTIVSLSPANNAVDVSGFSFVTITFSKSMDTNTIFSNSDCSGSIALSHNSFSSCISYVSAGGTANGTANVFSFEPAAPVYLSPAGNFKLRITAGAKDKFGNPLAATYEMPNGFTVLNDINPYVTTVWGETANGVFALGNQITFKLTFSSVVNVSGTPEVLMNTDKFAVYSGGSGTDTLSFVYTVQSGDNVATLNYKNTNSLFLPGVATIISASNSMAASLLLPETNSQNSLAANSSYRVATSAPAPSSLTFANNHALSLNLSWEAPEGFNSSYHRFIIKRNNTALTDCNSGTTLGTTTSLSFFDTTGVVNTTYHYAVCTQDQVLPLTSTALTGNNSATQIQNVSQPITGGPGTCCGTTINNIQLNGVSQTQITVAPGATIPISVTLSKNAAGTSIVPITFGIASTPTATAQSFWEPVCHTSTIDPPQNYSTSTLTPHLTAPLTPGTYYIRVRSGQVYCQASYPTQTTFWLGFGNGTVVARIIVQ